MRIDEFKIDFMGAIHEFGSEKGVPLWVGVALQGDTVVDQPVEIVPGLIRRDHFSAEVRVGPDDIMDPDLLGKGIAFHLRHGSPELRQTPAEGRSPNSIGSRSRLIRRALVGSIAFLF